MKIGIIGSGVVGQLLAKSFNCEGHSVMLGTRDTTKNEVVEFAVKNPFITTGTFEEAAIFGELIVLATAGSAVENAIALAGPANFSGKTVIDTTNPLSGTEPVNGVLSYFTKADESLMERIQKQIPEARVVKAFNSVGNAYMYKPQFEGGPPTMFICGNNDAAKKTVTGILTTFGWESEDMGKVEAARAIEPLCILWCIPGFIRNEWSHAFKLLKK